MTSRSGSIRTPGCWRGPAAGAAGRRVAAGVGGVAAVDGLRGVRVRPAPRGPRPAGPAARAGGRDGPRTTPSCPTGRAPPACPGRAPPARWRRFAAAATPSALPRRGTSAGPRRRTAAAPCAPASRRAVLRAAASRGSRARPTSAPGARAVSCSRVSMARIVPHRRRLLPRGRSPHASRGGWGLSGAGPPARGLARPPVRRCQARRRVAWCAAVAVAEHHA